MSFRFYFQYKKLFLWTAVKFFQFFNLFKKRKSFDLVNFILCSKNSCGIWVDVVQLLLDLSPRRLAIKSRLLPVLLIVKDWLRNIQWDQVD